MDPKDSLREDCPNIITPDWIQRQGVCGNRQFGEFTSKWPQGISWSRTNLLQIGELGGLDIDWLATTLLRPMILLEYEEKKSLIELETRQILDLNLEEYQQHRNLSSKNDEEWQDDPDLSKYKGIRDLIKMDDQKKKILVLADIIFGKEV